MGHFDRRCSIAYCPEHGLHGERQECFVCGGPVERVEMVPARSKWTERGRRGSLWALGLFCGFTAGQSGWGFWVGIFIFAVAMLEVWDG